MFAQGYSSTVTTPEIMFYGEKLLGIGRNWCTTSPQSISVPLHVTLWMKFTDGVQSYHVLANFQLEQNKNNNNNNFAGKKKRHDSFGIRISNLKQGTV